MGASWLICSPSIRGDSASLAARYAAALERFNALSTTSKSSSPTHSSSGPPGPGGSASSVFDVIERAIGYGCQPPQPPEGFDGPPLVTYETTPGPYGDVVRATDAYVAWFRRAYCLEGGADRVEKPGIDPPNKEEGGGDSGALVRRGRFKQHGLGVDRGLMLTS